MERVLKITALGVSIALTLAGCSKGNGSSRDPAAHPKDTTTRATPALSSASATANSTKASTGREVFNNNCATCHGADGQGLSGAVPPLAGNPVETGDAKKLIHIVKYGLTGSIQVKGHTYNGTMPAWGEQLSNSDIAAVITYERSSWGNSASPVTPSEVSAVSK